MEIDVYDLDISIASFISSGLKKYVEENKKAAFPTCGYGISKNDNGNLTDDEFSKKVSEWNMCLETLASKFEKLAKGYNRLEQKDINEAFDELKRVFSKLWI